MDLLASSRRSSLDVAPADVWTRVAAAGPGPHWYLDAIPLRVRGGLDRLLGGEPPADAPEHEALRVGDRAGFWEVRRAEHRTLDLVARVRAPGRVVLTTKVLPRAEGSTIVQTVSFRPRGWLGAAYLLADLPARELVIELVHRRTLRDASSGPRPDISDVG